MGSKMFCVSFLAATGGAMVQMILALLLLDILAGPLILPLSIH